jgi:uncharacterized protein (DUF39 family)
VLRTIDQINQRIKSGKVVVVTAEEVIGLAKKEGVKAAAKMVDVVTTGTFSPMCSSGAYFNLSQPTPKMKIGGGQAWLDSVPAYTGFAAADIFLGANAMPDDDPRNQIFPGNFSFGGAHVLCRLVEGEKVKLTGRAYGTDCYPRRTREEELSLDDFNEATMFNPRNAYQNYNVAVNLGDKTVYTYMGVLKRRLGNANYCSAGQLSPLLNDPTFRTLGLGTRVLLGGGIGYVVWHGTQHNPNPPRDDSGVPLVPSGTLALMGDLKQMKPGWLRPVSFVGYGVSLAVSMGLPIPILDADVLAGCAVTDHDISAPIIDYSEAYPQGTGAVLGQTTYGQLRSGKIEINGKKIPTGGLSSYAKARMVAETLKDWIAGGKFLLTNPAAPLPRPEGFGAWVGDMTPAPATRKGGKAK